MQSCLEIFNEPYGLLLEHSDAVSETYLYHQITSDHRHTALAHGALIREKGLGAYTLLPKSRASSTSTPSWLSTREWMLDESAAASWRL